VILRPQDTLNDLLEKVAESLDIPEELHRAAVEEYEQLAFFLEDLDQQAGRRQPEIYAQGSFALGTTTQPIKNGDDYDVDLVYERELKKESTSQKELKAEAGENLLQYVKYRSEAHLQVPKLTEGSRCWRLDFPGQFHMDILPAIPDIDKRVIVAAGTSKHILITDKSVRLWLPSNPREFADWFRSTMKVRFDAIKRSMAEARLSRSGRLVEEWQIKEAAEKIPEYEVKTPLQRAIQILKRHRDCRFNGDPENRPASILITTLAAKAYANESTLIDALFNLVHRMPEHIEERKIAGKRVAWVENPVNRDENFADRWQSDEYPDREQHFRSWLQQVQIELEQALKGGGIHKVIDLLGVSLGRRLVEASAKSLGFNTLASSSSGKLAVTSPRVTLVASAAPLPNTKPVRGHTFYGEA
jgi:hypothetical protein